MLTVDISLGKEFHSTISLYITLGLREFVFGVWSVRQPEAAPICLSMLKAKINIQSYILRNENTVSNFKKN